MFSADWLISERFTTYMATCQLYVCSSCAVRPDCYFMNLWEQPPHPPKDPDFDHIIPLGRICGTWIWGIFGTGPCSCHFHKPLWHRCPWGHQGGLPGGSGLNCSLSVWIPSLSLSKTEPKGTRRVLSSPVFALLGVISKLMLSLRKPAETSQSGWWSSDSTSFKTHSVHVLKC